ncbi:Uncharacterised protein [Mycoplasmopsis maculosa]|uniref:Uncharacterized protein n=1 Tax=Mycoplasmopsis maculosa TaxID=114885 RepID=A0A449B573_9BACT|nr:hypothetical protein [Mycoplasmopsis maculosa]VEU75753.1 Uncharacterised protein [Mycoplasmopsis maculosa]
MKINDIEYINKLSADEITQLSEEFKNSNERKRLKWSINKKITRKIVGQDKKIYVFIIYQYYYFKGKNKEYITYYPEKYKYLFKKKYDLKLILDTFKMFCGLIRNRYANISWNLCKYYSKKFDLFKSDENNNIEKSLANKIYISIDDCYDKTRYKNKVYKTNTKIIKLFSDTNQKPIYTYEVYSSNDNEKITNNSRAELIKKLIEKYYFIGKNTKLYLLSDGAKYFKILAKLLKANHIYDYFHFVKRFNDIFKKPVFVLNNKIKEKLIINNKLVKDWLKESIKNKKVFINKLNYLLNLNFSRKSIKTAIISFIKFIENNCPKFEFYINEITAQSESSVSLYKSIYKKRYSTFSLNTIFNFIKLNNNNNYHFIDFKSIINEFNIKIYYEPILWATQSYHKYF